MSAEEIYPELSEAIWLAENVRDQLSEAARSAYSRVSDLEEAVAKLLPAASVEGAIARRGAVRAALAAGEPARAWKLASGFLADPEARKDFELIELSVMSKGELAKLRRLSQKQLGKVAKVMKEVRSGTIRSKPEPARSRGIGSTAKAATRRQLGPKAPAGG